MTNGWRLYFGAVAKPWRLFGTLLVGMLVAVTLAATAHAAQFGFARPVLVDRTLAGGEPTVAFAVKSRLLVYTSHEGTTHLFSSSLPGAPAESGGWIGTYRNQVNIWTSANNGSTWQRVNELAGFFTNPLINTGFSDPDLTQDDAGNIYNTGIDLANDALFSSQDGGKTWPTGTAQCHEGDRPWLAGGKANEVFLSTDSSQSGHEVFHSTDAGKSCSANAIADHGSTADGGSYTGSGKLYYDHRRGTVIDPIYYSDKNAVVNGVGVGILHDASHAFSNSSAAFTQVHVAKTSAYSHWPALTIDSAGNYYLVWDTDSRNRSSTTGCPASYPGSEGFGGSTPAPTPLANSIMMSVSTNGGKTWSRPRTVAHPAGHRVLWPWVTAGSAGQVGVVWYQYDRVTDPDCGTGNVSVMAARISGANRAHPSEVVVNAAKRPIHSGAICAGGTTCAVTTIATGEDRRLGDYFTLGTDRTGCIIIATGDTTLNDAVTGQPSPISHPLFVRQNRGQSLTGKRCR
jgi:hypothetical protein